VSLIKVVATGLLGFGLSASAVDTCATGQDYKKYEVPPSKQDEKVPEGVEKYIGRVVGGLDDHVSDEFKEVNRKLDIIIDHLDEHHLDGRHPEGHADWHPRPRPIIIYKTYKIVHVHRHFVMCCCPPWW
jgi:hypothetical protein